MEITKGTSFQIAIKPIWGQSSYHKQSKPAMQKGQQDNWE
jgi:hypothetical protein